MDFLPGRAEQHTRRGLLKLSAAGFAGSALSGWLDKLAAGVQATGKRPYKSCVLLWMDGGPSHKDTFDLKPGTKDSGPYQQIQTSAPGVQISEHFPLLAKQMHHAALIRSMSTGEGAHGRAKYYLHTGYKEGVGGLNYPSIGSLVSAELGRDEFPLPNFVSIGNRSYGSGFLGPRHQPLLVGDPAKGVENLRPGVAEKQFDDRVGLLREMEAGFLKEQNAASAKAHQTTYNRAVAMMQSKEAKAFDLSLEPAAARERYGSGKFADGVLMARRLVEIGVPFVEVNLGGWDTHMDNFDRVAKLSGTVDRPAAALISDLQERGLLDTTLVVWMGDFGRTPKINSRGEKPGRDHYPRAWSSVMFGGGVKGGQVIGRTDKEGATVEDRPVSTIDFMASVCTVLGVDYTKERDTPIGRPIRTVDKGAKPIQGLI